MPASLLEIFQQLCDREDLYLASPGLPSNARLRRWGRKGKKTEFTPDRASPNPRRVENYCQRTGAQPGPRPTLASQRLLFSLLCTEFFPLFFLLGEWGTSVFGQTLEKTTLHVLGALRGLGFF